MEGRRFPKSTRVRRRSEFLRIQGEGRKAAAGPLLALAVQREGGETRLGLTVSKKVGSAVQRNRLRRRLREIFRQSGSQLPRGVDLVLVARTGAAVADFSELKDAFEKLAVKLKGLFP